MDLGQCLIHLAQHLTDAVVSPADGRLAPERNQKRRVPLDLGVQLPQQGIEIAAVVRVSAAIECLDVLLRHRPRSISRAPSLRPKLARDREGSRATSGSQRALGAERGNAGVALRAPSARPPAPTIASAAPAPIAASPQSNAFESLAAGEVAVAAGALLDAWPVCASAPPAPAPAGRASAVGVTSAIVASAAATPSFGRRRRERSAAPMCDSLERSLISDSFVLADGAAGPRSSSIPIVMATSSAPGALATVRLSTLRGPLCRVAQCASDSPGLDTTDPGGETGQMPNAARARASVPLAIVIVLSVLLCLAFPSGAPAKKRKGLPPIHVRGTVYTFGAETPIAGATVRVAELPGVSAETGPDGGYDLVVSDGTRFTPYAEAAGHHRIYLQTYVSQGKDLDRVNFQMPSDAAYNGLASILSVPRDANNELVSCAIVSTFSTVNVRDVSFSDFIAYTAANGGHGVAGATASASPALPNPIFFNESVIPDPSRTESSVDGGVIWPVVPAGVYRLTAHHPATRFAPFRATCEPGRVVNANPPQGFYELHPGEKVDTSVAASLASTHFDLSGSDALLKARVKAREYVAVSGALRRGKKTRAKRRTKGYAPGKRTLAFPVAAGLAGRRIAVKRTVEDAQGNVKKVSRKLRVPRR